jgi:hypothetical protein
MINVASSIVSESRARYPRLVFQQFSTTKQHPLSFRNALLWNGIKPPSTTRHLMVEIRDATDSRIRLEFSHNQSSQFSGISNRQLEEGLTGSESETRRWLLGLDFNSLPADVTDPTVDQVLAARKHLETTLGWIENLPGNPGKQIRNAKQLVQEGRLGSYVRTLSGSDEQVPGLIFLPPSKMPSQRAISK